ncbi:hypothetical protein Tco_0940622 [Tanacetum coccineum]|uniref:Uncharacterized protein n=1 Tax=Tanacetum coccineum TaxID=301880 RepID=A0ABQ5DQU2_9ASTR
MSQSSISRMISLHLDRCLIMLVTQTTPWIKADVPILGDLGKMGEPLGAEVDKPMVDPVIDELVEPIAAPVVVETKEQVIASMIDVEEDLAMLFGDDDFSNDNSEGFEDDEDV